MRFALVKIGGTRISGNQYQYRSTVMEKGASPKWTNTFDSEEELIEVMNRILAKQRTAGDVRLLIEKIRAGEHYFFDLNLTHEEAASLGWQPSTPTRSARGAATANSPGE